LGVAAAHGAGNVPFLVILLPILENLFAILAEVLINGHLSVLRTKNGPKGARKGRGGPKTARQPETPYLPLAAALASRTRSLRRSSRRLRRRSSSFMRSIFLCMAMCPPGKIAKMALNWRFLAQNSPYVKRCGRPSRGRGLLTRRFPGPIIDPGPPGPTSATHSRSPTDDQRHQRPGGGRHRRGVHVRSVAASLFRRREGGQAPSGDSRGRHEGDLRA